jgi:tRNA(Ile)-lysidine synthase TilS/MesJ
MVYYSEILKFESFVVDKDKLSFYHSVDKHKFNTNIIYNNIDFKNLEKEYGESFVFGLLVQMGILLGMKYCSLIPKYYNVSQYSSYINNDFIDFFNILYNKIFAQHKYENNLPNYNGPEFIITDSKPDSFLSTVEIPESDVKILVCNGGGKDSLLSLKLLENSKEAFSAIQYSHSIYGESELQHKLIDQINDLSVPIRQHKMDIIDNFMNEDILKDFPEIKTLCGAESFNSIFQIIPLMLNFRYSYLVLGHELSANQGNFYWDKINAEVNHQWEKSYEAENIINNYIKNNLISNFNHFSILRPIHDYMIFNLLKGEERHIKFTSSCNIDKPWCKRCPKCAYVWLGFMAYLAKDTVDEIFKENLFDIPELIETFLEMIGLKKHKPFECIGEIDEARLAVFKCYKKGLTGKVIDIFKEEILPVTNFVKLEEKYKKINYENQNIPDFLSENIFMQMKQAKI